MEVDSDTHPNPIVGSQHRKIELQSPHDLTYLQSNLIASANQKLDLHFPPSALRKNAPARQSQAVQPATVISLDGIRSTTNDQLQPLGDGNVEGAAAYPQEEVEDEEEEEDKLRTRVCDLVDAFIARTWSGAAQNVTVNGLDATSLPVLSSKPPTNKPKEVDEEQEGVDFTYEAYDPRLQAKVAGLYGELEALTAQVSKLRRTAPVEGAEAWTAVLAQERRREDDGFDDVMQVTRKKGGNDGGFELKALRDGWHDDVRAMYERGMSGLAALAGLQAEEAGASARGASLTETVGRTQRARTVAMEFE